MTRRYPTNAKLKIGVPMLFFAFLAACGSGGEALKTDLGRGSAVDIQQAAAAGANEDAHRACLLAQVYLQGGGDGLETFGLSLPGDADLAADWGLIEGPCNDVTDDDLASAAEGLERLLEDSRATTAPTRVDEPESTSKDRAERGLLQLSDLPSGFFEQRTEVTGTSETSPILAKANRSFDGPPSYEALGEGLILFGVGVFVMSDEDEAQSRVEPDFLESLASALANDLLSIVDPEIREISFAPLGDDSTAVELLGTGTLFGQRLEIVHRSIGVRQGNILGMLDIVTQRPGSISELEDLAAKFADILEEAAN